MGFHNTLRLDLGTISQRYVNKKDVEREEKQVLLPKAWPDSEIKNLGTKGSNCICNEINYECMQTNWYIRSTDISQNTNESNHNQSERLQENLWYWYVGRSSLGSIYYIFEPMVMITVEKRLGGRRASHIATLIVVVRYKVRVTQKEVQQGINCRLS